MREYGKITSEVRESASLEPAKIGGVATSNSLEWPTMPTDSEPPVCREIDSRESDGISVTWCMNGDKEAMTIFVRDTKTGTNFDFDISPDKANEAYHHPYAFAPSV